MDALSPSLSVSLSLSLLPFTHFFHQEPVMSIRWMTDFCPLSSSQHPLRGNQYFNMSNWIFVPHYMSDGGSGVCRCGCVTSFKRVYFNQYHLFSLPFTQPNCIKKAEHNICCQLMYAVMDINDWAVEYFTSQPWKLWGTVLHVQKKTRYWKDPEIWVTARAYMAWI